MFGTSSNITIVWLKCEYELVFNCNICFLSVSPDLIFCKQMQIKTIFLFLSDLLSYFLTCLNVNNSLPTFYLSMHFLNLLDHIDLCRIASWLSQAWWSRGSPQTFKPSKIRTTNKQEQLRSVLCPRWTPFRSSVGGLISMTDVKSTVRTAPEVLNIQEWKSESLLMDVRNTYSR